jgi:hypothetical protein
MALTRLPTNFDKIVCVKCRWPSSSPSAAPAAPSLRQLVPSGSLIRCESVRVYNRHLPAVCAAKVPRLRNAPTSIALTPFAVFPPPFRRGPALPQCLTPIFRILTEDPTVCFIIFSTRAFLKIQPDVLLPLRRS